MHFICTHQTRGFLGALVFIVYIYTILQPRIRAVALSLAVNGALYTMYYKPMGDHSYISSEPGRLIIRNELIYEYTIYKPIEEL